MPVTDRWLVKARRTGGAAEIVRTVNADNETEAAERALAELNTRYQGFTVRSVTALAPGAPQERPSPVRCKKGAACAAPSLGGGTNDTPTS